jgi:hypothetical protein
LNYQPHRGQLGGQNEQKQRDNMGKVKDMGVVNQIREKNMREKCSRNSAKQKMNEGKKRFDKRITMMRVHK